jgi:hypothetical protein
VAGFNCIDRGDGGGGKPKEHLRLTKCADIFQRSVCRGSFSGRSRACTGPVRKKGKKIWKQIGG